MEETYEEWVRDYHAFEVRKGRHDDKCEWRYDGFFVCHCAKRQREASGLTEALEDIEFIAPHCPRCGAELYDLHDGWECQPCSTMWDRDGTNARFTDVYGDDLAADVAKWERTHK